MSDLERGERLQIMLSADELRAVENWRFEKRMPSRAAAVRELLRRGLLAEGFAVAGEGVARVGSAWSTRVAPTSPGTRKRTSGRP